MASNPVYIPPYYKPLFGQDNSVGERLSLRVKENQAVWRMNNLNPTFLVADLGPFLVWSYCNLLYKNPRIKVCLVSVDVQICVREKGRDELKFNQLEVVEKESGVFNIVPLVMFYGLVR